MALIRWEPARDVATFQNEMNRLFTTVFDTPSNGSAALPRWVPAMDLVETGDHFVLRADLPGLADEDVSIEVEDRVLTISGTRESEHEAGDGGFYRVERSFGDFRRSLTLPEGIEPEAVSAAFDKGVLTVHIPKPEERKPHTVAIAVGKPAIDGSANAAS